MNHSLKNKLFVLMALLALTFSTLGTTPAYAAPLIEVANTNDSGAGSLRQAIADVDSGGTITFNSSLSGATITLSSVFNISKSIIIDGSALASRVILSGGGTQRVFYVNGGSTLTLKNITVANGYADYGGGIFLNSSGSLVVENSLFTGNTANGGYGGAISSWFVSGNTVTIKDSTFSGNSATGGGAAFANNNGFIVKITGSTFTGNNSGGAGAVYQGSSGITIANSTFASNGVGGLIITGYAYIYNVTFSESNFGINNTGSIEEFYNVIVDGSCTGSISANNSNNILSSGVSSCGLINGVNSNQVGVSPQLIALTSNGGLTDTMALQAGSPAIDAGDDTTCTDSPVSGVDQRGTARPQSTHCDIGSYEVAIPVAPTVSTDSVETLSARNVNATISSLGFPASVTHHGVVYSTSSGPTTSDSMIDHGTTTIGTYHIGLDEMGLTAGTKYYVRAFASNATGTSYGTELVVYGTPGAFTGIAPLNNATDVSTSPTLSWNASTGATDYQYCVQADIADCVADMFGANWHSTGGATSANVSGLLTSTNYVWAVRAVVGTPASYKWVTGAPFSFTTASGPAHTVTFNGNGSNGGSMSNQSANSATALTANAFTRTDYAFTGWNTAANGSGTAYADGATYNFSADITLYAQWTLTNSANLPSPWIGSVSISADKNVVTVGRPHIGSEIASYDGASSGATSAYVPMLFKDAFGGSYDAALYVQNVSGSSANITIKFYDSTGTLSCTKNDTVSSLASKGYWLPSESCLPTGWVGGALVTSDQNIVAIGRPHIGAEVMTYNGFSAGSTSAYLPMLFKDAFGGSYDSAFYVQNVSVSSANLTIKYFDSAGTLNCTKSDTLASFASKGYWLPSATCDSGSIPVGWVGSVVVTSDQNIVSVGRPHIGSQVTTYNAFTAGSISSFVPMLFKDAFGGSYDAAFYIQNVHAINTANITIKYYNSAGTLNCTKSDTLAPLASKGYWVPSATCDSGSLPVGWVGSVEVTSDQPIIGIGRPHIGTQVTTYKGFSSGNPSSFLSMLFKDAFGGSYDSAFYIQNTEATQATVTTSFYDSTGTLSCSRTDIIPAKSTLGIWAPNATCEP